jgi:poly [ADP-ribose] polymerase 2/3/4
VFIDDDGTIFDASLNQTVSGQNKNKFYRVQILVSANGKGFRTWTRWGRVGEGGQNATLGQGSLVEAKKHFERKFKDKSGYSWTDRFEAPKKGKYTFIERSYEEDSGEEDDILPGASIHGRKGSLAKTEDDEPPKRVESKLPDRVQLLMQLIFNQQYFAASMAAMDYDANKLPLGKLSKRTLMAGYERLKEIAELLADPSLAQSRHQTSINNARSQLSDAFYTVIPHSFGRNRPPVISDEALLKKEIALLESLSDMEIASGIMKEAKMNIGDAVHTIHELDRQYNGLGMREMTPRKCAPMIPEFPSDGARLTTSNQPHHTTNRMTVETSSNEYKVLEEYLLKSHGTTHNQKFQVGLKHRKKKPRET